MPSLLNTARTPDSSCRPAASSLTVLDFLELRVDDVVVTRGRRSLGRFAAGLGARTTGCRAGFGLAWCRGIDLFAELLAGAHQRLGLGVDGCLVLALERLL